MYFWNSNQVFYWCPLRFHDFLHMTTQIWASHLFAVLWILSWFSAIYAPISEMLHVWLSPTTSPKHDLCGDIQLVWQITLQFARHGPKISLTEASLTWEHFINAPTFLRGGWRFGGWVGEISDKCCYNLTANLFCWAEEVYENMWASRGRTRKNTWNLLSCTPNDVKPHSKSHIACKFGSACSFWTKLHPKTWRTVPFLEKSSKTCWLAQLVNIIRCKKRANHLDLQKNPKHRHLQKECPKHLDLRLYWAQNKATDQNNTPTLVKQHVSGQKCPNRLEMQSFCPQNKASDPDSFILLLVGSLCGKTRCFGPFLRKTRCFGPFFGYNKMFWTFFSLIKMFWTFFYYSTWFGHFFSQSRCFGRFFC